MFLYFNFWHGLFPIVFTLNPDSMFTDKANLNAFLRAIFHIEQFNGKS